MKRTLSSFHADEQQQQLTCSAANSSSVGDVLASSVAALSAHSPPLPSPSGSGSEFCYINQLPNEVLELILYYLRPYGDAQNAGIVCKRWYRICKALLGRRKRDFAESANTGRLYATVYDLPEGPAARYTHSCVYHRGSLYLFGGSNTESATFNDLWRFDLNSRTWQRVIAQGNPPSPRSMATLVPYGDSLYLFGGWHPPPPAQVSPGQYQPRFFADLDVFSTRNERWERIFGLPSPAPVCAHSCVVLERQKLMVIFGGFHVQRRVSNRVSVFRLSEKIWESEDRVEGPRPDARYGHACALVDEEHMLVVGGSTMASDEAGASLRDAWLLTMPPMPTNILGVASGPDDANRPAWRWTRIEVHDQHLAPPTMWVLSPAKISGCLVYFSKLSDTLFNQYAQYWAARANALAASDGALFGCHSSSHSHSSSSTSLEEQFELSQRNNRGAPSSNNNNNNNNNRVAPPFAGRVGRSMRRLEQLEKYLVKKKVGEVREVPESVLSARLRALPHFLDISTAVTGGSIRWLSPTMAIPPGAAPDQSLFHTISATPYEAVIFGGLQTDLILLTSQDPMSRPACRRIVLLHALPLNEFSSPSL